MGDIITQIDKYKKGWTGGLPETPCGAGSRMRDTRLQRAWIPGVISEYNINTIADIGAGDLNWFPKMNLACEVTHYDLVPRNPNVIQFDIIKEIPPKVDLIMCLWVLNHFPFDHCRQAIENIKLSGAKYLMMTDRLKYRKDQPPEIEMPFIEQLILPTGKGDSIMLIALDEIC